MAHKPMPRSARSRQAPAASTDFDRGERQRPASDRMSCHSATANQVQLANGRAANQKRETLRVEHDPGSKVTI